MKTDAYRLIERAFNYVEVGGIRLRPITKDARSVIAVRIRITKDGREEVVGVRSERRR